jgi:hypothetical protein
MSIMVLPLRYHPNEPVENSLVGTTMGTSPTVTVTGLARPRNSDRVTGQTDFLAIASSLKARAFLTFPAASYHGARHGNMRLLRGGRWPGAGRTSGRLGHPLPRSNRRGTQDLWAESVVQRTTFLKANSRSPEARGYRSSEK